MTRFNFQKQIEFQSRLIQIYNSTSNELKSSVTLYDFINAFPIIEHAGRGVEPDKPEDFAVDDDTYNNILEAFREVYDY